MHHQHRLDRVLAIFAQPALEPRRIGGGPPIVGQGLDLEPEGFATHAPIEREIAALDDQHLVARRKQIDQRGLPCPVPRGGIGKDRLIGLEHPLETGDALLGDGAELGAVEVDRAAIHRSQYPVRDVGRTGIDEEMVPSTNRHTRSPASSHRIPARVRHASVPLRAPETREGRTSSCLLLASAILPKLGPVRLLTRFLRSRSYVTARRRSRHF